MMYLNSWIILATVCKPNYRSENPVINTDGELDYLLKMAQCQKDFVELNSKVVFF